MPRASTRLHRWRKQLVFLVLLALGVVAFPKAAAAQDAALALAQGRLLFEREWTPATSETEAPLGGDGLGPAFNDRSCVACHRQGGVGGGGPLDKNVDMLSLPSEDVRLSGRQERELQKLHPGFLTKDGLNSSIVLHKFMLDQSYGTKRQALLNDEPLLEPHPQLVELTQHRFASKPLQPVTTSFGITLVRAQRNTTSLFGSGLLDQVPDQLLLELEKQQPRAFPGITGRASPAPGGIGRFGWRGRTARLSEFVLQACANELGLQVQGNQQGMLPTQPEYQPRGVDMSPQDALALVAFVASLPAPQRIIPESPSARDMIREGRRLFASVGCIACHMERLGSVAGVYSDLLLHDMGPGLADPAPAQPDIALVAVDRIDNTRNMVVGDQIMQVRKQGPVIRERMLFPSKQMMLQTSRAAAHGLDPGKIQEMAGATVQSYYGGSRVVQKADHIKVIKGPTNIYQEWRTPPLWDVQDSAPYLHDGRAATLVEAIAWHGGEGENSAQRYFALPAADRLKVLAFLRTLRAPQKN